MKKILSIAILVFGIFITAYSTTRIQTPSQQMASTDNLTEYVSKRATTGEAFALFSIGMGLLTIGFLTIKTKQ